jgi:AraC-like DNA-binding protein
MPELERPVDLRHFHNPMVDHIRRRTDRSSWGSGSMSTFAIHAERPHTTPILLSSDAFDERDRFDAWREELMLKVIRVDVDVPDRANFHTRLRILTLPNISIIERRSIPSIVRRTAELVRDGDDSLVFSLPWRKSMEARGPADWARVGPGEAIIHSLNDTTSSRAPQGFRGVSLRIARKTALTVAPDAARRLNRAIPVDRSASAILRLYLVSLVSTPGGLSPSVATLADRHLRELLANVFDPEGDHARAEVYGGIKAARLKAVDREIALRLADPTLSAAAVGRRLQLSERYVQQLLEGAGLSFTAYLRDLRLKRARQLLRDPMTRHLRIGDVALMAGFNDLSHFNRMFRLQFGERPTDTRRSQ